MSQSIDEAPLRISAQNWRITWIILVFAALSLAASALPLLPDIEKRLPLDMLGRRDAMALYSCMLLAFSAFVFPLILRPPEEGGRSVGAAWCVGALILAFAGIPLFVLAYIAGVHIRGVFAVLAWAGILQSGVLLFLWLTRYRLRVPFVIGLAALIVYRPLAGFFDGLFRGDPATSVSLSPFDAVLGVTRKFEEAPILGLLAVLATLQLILIFVSRRSALSPTLAAFGALGTVLVLGAATGDPQAESRAPARALAGGLVIEGRPTALFLRDSSAEELQVDVAGRERFLVGDDALRRGVWLNVDLLAGGERLRILDSKGGELQSIEARIVAPDRGLVLAIGTAGSRLDPEGRGRPDLDLIQADAGALPESRTGFSPFSALLIEDGQEALLPPASRSALDAYVRAGGALWRVADTAASPRGLGAGRVLTLAAGQGIPSSLPLELRGRRVLDENLYSNFARPDWGQVDLSGLLVFLLVYHFAFYLAFLLPLIFDAKKSSLVYLVSASFVVGVTLVGGWLAVKQIFLRETQILQQNLGIYVFGGEGEDASVVARQICCFASFNGQSSPISLSRSIDPELVHESMSVGAGRVRVEDDHLVLEAPRLDRFRSKQVLKFSRVLPAPFAVERQGEDFVVRPRNRPDLLGLSSGRWEAAFVRREGRLYPVTIEGRRLRVSETPSARSWLGVIPEDFRDRQGIPFVRYALGRYAAPGVPILVILASGIRSLHEDGEYLDRRDIGQLLVLPLPAF